MKKVLRPFLFALCCLIASTMMAQHTISGTIRNLNSQKLYIESYTGFEKKLVDSIWLLNDGFVFDGKLEKGMYSLTDRNTFELEFLSVQKPIRFVIQDASDLRTVQFFDDTENEKWLAYLIERQDFRLAKKTLREVLENYNPTTEFYRQSKLEYKKVTFHYQHFVDSLLDTDDSYADLLIRADRELPIDIEMTAQQQCKWLAENFFRDVDFYDLSLIPTNVLTTKMLDYLVLYQSFDDYSSNSNLAFVMALDKILALAKTNFKMYEFVMEYMLEGFSKLGLSDVVDYLLNYPQLYEGDITMEQSIHLDSITNPYQKVRVGVKSPNITGITIDERAFNLYASPSPFTIVFFWSTECDFCHDYMKNMSSFLKEHPDVELVTVALADRRKEVQNYISKMKISGYHFYDELRWEGPMFKDFHVFSTPTIFILDAEKNIVSKPYDWDELSNFFKNGNE